VHRIISMFLICILCGVTITGCFDAKEVTDWAYVHSIGMEHGVKDKLRMSIQVPSTKESTSGGGMFQGSTENISTEESGGILTITLDCPTFYSGVNMINCFLSRELNYMHTKYFVFSESLAREEIGTYINAFIRGRQIRRQIYVVISRGSASEFLKNNTVLLGDSLTKKQESLMEQSKITGLFSDVKYGEFIDSMKTPYGQSIASLAAVNKFQEFWDGEATGKTPAKTGVPYYAGQLPRKGGSKVEFLGTAVFNGGKMVGELNGDETRALLMIRGDFKRGNFTVQDPKKPEMLVTIDVRRQKKRKVKVDLKGNKPIIDIHVYLEGDILAIQSTVDYEKKDLKPLLENALREQIKKNLEKTVKKCQDLNADVLKLGAAVGMHFWTIQEFEEYNWLSKFKDATVNVDVDFLIRRTGTMLKSREIMSPAGIKDE